MYDFKNIETGVMETRIMTIAAMEDYVKDPNITQVLSAPALITGKDGAVLKQAGDGWKEVQQKIQGGMPPKDRHRIKTK